MKQIIGLYPGSFDPITNWHLDIILRASKIVDTLIIGVAINEKKKTSRLQNIIRGIIGLTTLLLIAAAFSRNRKKINWKFGIYRKDIGWRVINKR